MHMVQGQLGQENQQNQVDSQNIVQAYTNFLSPSSELAMDFNFDIESTGIFQFNFNSTTNISSSSSTAVIATTSSISPRTTDEISSFRDFSFSHLMAAGEETRVRALSSHDISAELPTPESSITGTGSAAFYGDNPVDGGTMSPLMMGGAVSSNYQYMEDSMDTDDIFTPLVSPAITPSYPQIHPPATIADSINITPLSSPVLAPHQAPYLFSSSASSILPSSALNLDSQALPITGQIHHNLSSPSLTATTPVPITKSPRVSKSPTNRLKSTSKIATSYEVIQKSPPAPKRKRSTGSITSRQAKGTSSLSTSSPQLQPSRTSPKLNLTQSPSIGTTTSMPPPLQPIGASSPLLTTQSPVAAVYSPASRPQHWAQPLSSSLLLSQQIQQQSFTPSTSAPLTSTSSSSSAMAPATPASLMKLASTTTSTLPILTPVPRPALYASPVLHPSPSQRTSPALLPSPSLHPLQPLLTSPAMTPVPMPPPMMPGVMVPMSPTAITRSPGGKGGAIRTKDSSRAKLRTISPVLRPNINSAAISPSAITQLTQNSNYTTIASGAHNMIGITYSPAIHTGIEVRRTSHKAAEQRRRDTLKQSFERLRDALADFNPASNNNSNHSNDHVQDEQSQSGSSDNEDGISTSPRHKKSTTDQSNHQSIEGSNMKASSKDVQKDEKQMSKVLLLTRCLECIEELKQKSTEKDKRINELENEVNRLKSLNGESGNQKGDDTVAEKKEWADDSILATRDDRDDSGEKEQKEKINGEKVESNEKENEKDIVITEKS